MFGSRDLSGKLVLCFIVALGCAAAVVGAGDATSPWLQGAGASTPPITVSAAGDALETVGGGWFYWTATPFAFTRFDGGYSPYDGSVYFLGGRLASGSTPDTDGSVWSFNPRTQSWTYTGVDLEVPISNYQVNLYEDEVATVLLTFCGRPEGGGVINQTQFYTVSAGVAGVLPASDDFPGSLTCASGLNAVWHNKVVVAGGFDPAVPPYHPTETWIFDADYAFGGPSWSNLPTAVLTPARAYMMSAVVDDRVYAIGGAYYDTSSAGLINVDTVQRLDPAAATPVWTTLAPLPEPCSSGRAWGFDSDTDLAAFGTPLAGKIVTTCSGWPDENEHVYIYDTRSDSWEEFPFLHTDRRDFAAEYVPATGGMPGPAMAALWVWGGRQNDDLTVLDTSEVYQLEPSLCSVLLVNDDPNSVAPSYGGLPYYMTALDELGVLYNVWDIPSVGSPPWQALAGYDAVVWFTGSDYSDAVNASEQANLITYLNGGGTLILSAQDQVYAHGLTPLLTDYFMISTVGQDVGPPLVAGTDDPLYAGVAECPLIPPETWGTYWTTPLYADIVTAGPGAMEPLEYPAIALPSAVRDDGRSFRTMFMGFPVEWVRTVEARADVLGPMLRWSICPMFEDGFDSGGALRWGGTRP